MRLTACFDLIFRSALHRGLAFAFALASLMRGEEALPLGQSIADAIIPSGLSVEIELFAEMPPTSKEPPLTRINAMATPPDGSGRLFINDLRGKVYEISDGEPSLYMDYAKLVPELHHESGIGSGLGSVAFHPDFGTSGKFYTTHVEKLAPSAVKENLPLDSKEGWTYGVITEWTVIDPKDGRFKGSRREVLRVSLPTAFHGLQHIAFNPNSQVGDPDRGMLYVCLGEGGALRRRESERLRKLKSPLGCILRIDPLGSGGALGDYGVPGDNPWANHADPDVLGEIWCLGIRNPHRISWDTGGTGRMIFSEIGEMRVEEINIGEPGRDYGWPVREGTFRYDPHGEFFEIFTLAGEVGENELELTYPVAQYDHIQGFAISGGGVYRGAGLPELDGKYVFGDIVTGKLYFVEEPDLKQGSLATIYELQLEMKGESVSMASLLDGGRVDLRIGWDAEGEMYLFEKIKGRVYKAVGVNRLQAL